MTSSLIPNLDKYYDNGLNVMFIGLHGMGKSETVMQFAKKHEIRFHYVSAALIDPWTDLAGIPTPRRHCDHCNDWWPVDMRVCPDCKEHLGHESLVMVRPHLIDSAELIMADEFNRGLPKTTNALFELIQFKSINGEKLPYLKCVWAAINPPDSGQYAVEDLDPALVDRFDIYINLNPVPSYAYYNSLGFKRENINAVLAWYKDINKERRVGDQVKNHISLRRLEKMLRVYEATDDITLAMAPWIDYDRNKLLDFLQKARDQQAKRDKIYGGQFGKGAYSKFEYTPEWLEGNASTVADYLKDHPDDIDTNKHIAQILSSKYGKTLSQLSFLDILENMNQTVVEGMVDNMGDTKRGSFFEGIESTHDMKLGSYPNLIKIKDQFDADFEVEVAESVTDIPF